jgi:hypothetical protein
MKKIPAVLIEGKLYVEIQEYVELLEAYTTLSEKEGKILIPFGTELQSIPTGPIKRAGLNRRCHATLDGLHRLAAAWAGPGPILCLVCGKDTGGVP